MMYRILHYTGLFLATALLQIFLFDNLTLSVYLHPLIYVVFVALLPLETAPFVVLMAGLFAGVAMDWSSGAAGVNTIATVLLAFVRVHLLNFTAGRETVHDGGIPSEYRMGTRSFLIYLALVVGLHGAVFFLVESLSLAHLPLTLLRWALSSAVTWLFAWLIARLFTAKVSLRA